MRDMDANDIDDNGTQGALDHEVMRLDPESYSRELLVEIAQRFPPALIARKLAELAGAMVMDKFGNYQPEWKTQSLAVKMLLDYTVGKPVARSEHVNVNVDVENDDDIREQIRHSPALRAKLEEMIGKKE